MKDHQSPPTNIRDFKKRAKALGLAMEHGPSGHYNVIRADGVVIARVTSTPGPCRGLINEWKRVEKRAAQEAGGRWTR